MLIEHINTCLKMSRKKSFLFMLLVFCQLIAAAQSFVKVNSGTKSDITDIKMFSENEGYFMADKIYALKNGVEWTKQNFPSIRPITLFSANSANDFWYISNLENSTSVYYHFHNSSVENFVGPFGVSTYAACLSPDNTPFFASFTEVALFINGQFQKIPLAPTRFSIMKIVARSSKLFWILTRNKELFVYEGEKYRRILKDKNVTDFQIIDEKLGYALCDDELIGFNDNIFKTCSVNEAFRKTEKIFVTKKYDIWLIGPQSKILKFSGGRLYDYSLKEKYTLRDISVVGEDEVWISGNEGILLYRGKKVLPPYQKIIQGFSSFKLTGYSIDLDNEYGVAMADLNGDNNLDIFSVCISSVNRLFINAIDMEGNSSKGNFFIEEGLIRNAEGAAMSNSTVHTIDLKLGVTVADVDNDGDEDIYICSLNSGNKLLLNNGFGVFRDVSDQPFRACENFDRSTAAAFADVDLDGSVDLYVTSENKSNKLFHNDGTGHFTDITESAGLETTYGGSCASFSDINNDGLPDLCATFWFGQNRIYLNETKNGVIKFRDITSQTDLARLPPVKSNGVTFADINIDGSPDLFIANRNDRNRLYLNNGKGNFKDVTDSYFEKKTYLSNGGIFADFDQDGFLDLYLTNVGDNILYKGISGNYFMDVTTNFGAEFSGYSTGIAVGDLDNDRNPDFYVANFLGGSSKVFMNQSKNRNNLKIKLEGYLSNRDAIGAKIYLYQKNNISGDILVGTHEISGGGSYASISAKEAIFPLVPGYQYFAVIKFPFPGSEKVIEDLKPGYLLVKEQTGFPAITTRLGKSVFLAFKDPEIRMEILKIAFVFFILALYYKRFIDGKDRIMRIRKLSVYAIFISFIICELFFVYVQNPILYSIPVIVVCILMIIMHLISERMQISQNLLAQRLKLREQISRDLHDDLASTLGSISIYSDTLIRIENPGHSEFKKLTKKIAELTHSALQSITDIIWMTSPKNDSVQGLLAKANNLLYEIIIDNGIEYHSEINAPDKPIVLPDELKNDIFLILKEATHNIIRHSKAKSVALNADINDLTCIISLMDDGIGFDEKNLQLQVSHGNGLINMRKRAIDSKIDLSINSQEGKGTVITLVFKI
jgi:signal transduction histidine kinase